MQTSKPADSLRLTFYCKDPASVPGEDCATFYRTSEGTWIVQGDRREEPRVVRQLVALKPSESSVEVPGPLIDLFVRIYAKEHYGIDLG